MKTLTRTLILALVSTFVVLGAGCGDPDDDSKDNTQKSTGSSTTDDTPVVSDGGDADDMTPTDSTPDAPVEVDLSACTADHAPADSADWIANFEIGTLQAGNGVDEYIGVYAFHDGTDGADMIPPKSDDAVGDAETSVSACSTAILCARNTAGTFDTWGAGLGIDWKEDASVQGQDGENIKFPRDLSEYKGVALYALRLGGVSSIRVGFPDLNTHPHGDVCEVDGDTTGCYNDWGTNLLLTDENVWTRHEILFSDIEINKDWGAQPTAFQQDTVYGMKFQVGEKADFDFCIDDIYLIKNDE